MILRLAIVFAFIILPSYSLIGQNKIHVQVMETYTIKPMGDLQDCELRIPIPQDHPRYQSVRNIIYSVRPYMAKVSNSHYAVFKLNKSDLNLPSSITIQMEIEVRDYDLSVASQDASPHQLKKGERKRYLKNTGLYKLSEDYINDTLVDTSIDKIETANRIHDFVVDHISYQTFFGKSMGAQHAMETGKGDCTEYADLMIALSRYSNIPARRIAGFTIRSDTTDVFYKLFNSSGHNWVEVFFDQYGWVPFDPTHSDGSYITNFRNLSPKYVYLNFDETEKGYHWSWLGNGSVEVTRKRTYQFVR